MLGFFLDSHNMLKPRSFVGLTRERDKTNETVNNASINPVGTYQSSIEGKVTVIPPSVPTIGATPISMPTAKAVRMFHTHAVMNNAIPRRFLLEHPLTINFTTKKEEAPITPY